MIFFLCHCFAQREPETEAHRSAQLLPKITVSIVHHSGLGNLDYPANRLKFQATEKMRV